MRRWFLARFYRLGLASWFDPPTRYVDKEPSRTEVVGDSVHNVDVAADEVLASAAVGDEVVSASVTSDTVSTTTPVGDRAGKTEVDP